MARIRRGSPIGALLLAVSACASPVVDPSPAGPAAHAEGLVPIADDRSIWVRCAGTGSPTVVLIAGKGNGAADWLDILAPDDPVRDAPGDDLPLGMGSIVPSDDAVFPSVARFTRVCAYDRPDIRVGAEVTTPRAQPHTVDADVDDLHAMLDALGESGPYVLVAHSYGGLIADLFARTHPHDVSGLVMLDAATAQIAHDVRAEQLVAWDASNALTSEQVHEGVRLLDAFDRIAAAGPLPDVPAAVLSADKPWRTDLLPPEVAAVDTVTFEDWARAQVRLALELGVEQVAETGSGHDIGLYQPALVVRTIRAVVDEVRAG